MFKKVLFYLCVWFNLFAAVVYLDALIFDTTNPNMPWGFQGGGWTYENNIYYALSALFDFLVSSVPTVYAVLKYQKKPMYSLWVILIPTLYNAAKIIYFSFFYNI